MGSEVQYKDKDMRIEESNNTRVVHMQTEPVIILGHARSGTSILGDLLRKYFQISFGPESQFLIRFQQNLPAYGDLAQEPNLRRLLHDVLKERCFKRWHEKFGYALDESDIFHSIKEPNFKEVVFAVFEYLARSGGMERWGDKTPQYSWHLGIIKELFPDSKYIHIVRDGRDVALSSFNIHFGSKNVYKVARRWTEELKRVQEFKQSIPAEQFIEMRYEDLMQKPSKELIRLISFLGIQDSEFSLQQYIRHNVERDLKKNNYHKWKNRMTAEDVFIFEAVSKDWLHGYGYEVVNDGFLPASLPVVRKWYWEIQDVLSKIAYKDHLTDNLYKLKTRLKYAFRKYRALF